MVLLREVQAALGHHHSVAGEDQVVPRRDVTSTRSSRCRLAKVWAEEERPAGRCVEGGERRAEALPTARQQQLVEISPCSSQSRSRSAAGTCKNESSSCQAAGAQHGERAHGGQSVILTGAGRTGAVCRRAVAHVMCYKLVQATIERR